MEFPASPAALPPAELVDHARHVRLANAQIASALFISANEPVHAFAGKIPPGSLLDRLVRCLALVASAVRQLAFIPRR
jgi:hypothetical protein